MNEQELVLLAQIDAAFDDVQSRTVRFERHASVASPIAFSYETSRFFSDLASAGIQVGDISISQESSDDLPGYKFSALSFSAMKKAAIIEHIPELARLNIVVLPA